MRNTPHRLRRALALLLTLCIFTAAHPLAAAEDEGHFEQEEARTMLGMINDFRTGTETWYWNEDNKTKTWCRDLKPLTYDRTLEQVAMVRAKELATLYDHNHKRPDGTDCFTAYPKGQYNYKGENIAMGYPSAKTVMGVETVWNSQTQMEDDGWLEAAVGYEEQGHRRTMLNADFTFVGVGHYVENGVHYWAQEFGSKTMPIRLSWSRNKTVTGYQLQYATNKKYTKNKKTVKIKGNKNNSYTIPKAKLGKTYYVRVRGYKIVKKKIKYGKWAKFDPIPVKAD